MLTNDKIESLDNDVNHLNDKLEFLYLDFINLFKFNFHEKTELETSNRINHNSTNIMINLFNKDCFWSHDGFLTIIVTLAKNDGLSFEYSHGSSGGRTDAPQEISAQVFSEGLQYFVKLTNYIKIIKMK